MRKPEEIRRLEFGFWAIGLTVTLLMMSVILLMSRITDLEDGVAELQMYRNIDSAASTSKVDLSDG